MADPEDTWPCEAYGLEGLALGLRCFFSENGHRLCGAAEECHGRMVAARQRLNSRMNELAANGDPTGVYLAERFTHPEQLLGGSEAPPDETDSY
ncbi:hypothetical protein [Nocardia tengchongensis]|uniref:hypothetical protein n=1 Tax=Nocardia tengchongensis TaxID=2055889 RepID=UPI00367CEEA4